jgi:hypothetical protein
VAALLLSPVVESVISFSPNSLDELEDEEIGVSRLG